MHKPLSMMLLAVICNMVWLFSSSGQRSDQLPEQSITIPEQYRDMELVKCSPSKLEREFARQFPGVIETYKHKDGLLILRQVSGATRKLHDTRICLKSGGYTLSQSSIVSDEEEREWQTYAAVKESERFEVKSIIISQSDQRNWHSVEEWFWSAFFSKSNGGYLAITEITPSS